MAPNPKTQVLSKQKVGLASGDQIRPSLLLTVIVAFPFDVVLPGPMVPQRNHVRGAHKSFYLILEVYSDVAEVSVVAAQARGVTAALQHSMHPGGVRATLAS
jgi:hypothetical protein